MQMYDIKLRPKYFGGSERRWGRGDACRTIFLFSCGWSGDAMALGNLPVPGRPTVWTIVGQGPTALAAGAGGGVWTCLLSSILSLLCLPFYRLKYCLKGPLNPKQQTNHPF